MTSADIGDLTFEEALQRLERTVRDLRAEGGVPLSRAVDLYEAGHRLARHCEMLLRAADVRISQIDEEDDLEGDALPPTVDPIARDLLSLLDSDESAAD